MAKRGGGRDERLRKQKEYRKRMKGARAPDRDEIARQLLHYAITENLKRDRESELWHMADSVIERLVERGSDLEASRQVFVGIVDRYEKGLSFQRRVHLLEPPKDDAGDEGNNCH